MFDASAILTIIAIKVLHKCTRGLGLASEISKTVHVGVCGSETDINILLYIFFWFIYSFFIFLKEFSAILKSQSTTGSLRSSSTVVESLFTDPKKANGGSSRWRMWKRSRESVWVQKAWKKTWKPEKGDSLKALNLASPQQHLQMNNGLRLQTEPPRSVK